MLNGSRVKATRRTSCSACVGDIAFCLCEARVPCFVFILINVSLYAHTLSVLVFIIPTESVVAVDLEEEVVPLVEAEVLAGKL